MKKNASSFGPQLLHFKRMIRNYYFEVGKMDVEISIVAKRRVTAKARVKPKMNE